MAKMAIFAAALAALLMSPAALAVNKCKGPDGKIVYSDLPCPMETKQIDAPNLTNTNQTNRRSGDRARPDTGPLPPIDFGSDQQTQLNRAAAIVASILVDARGCDWDLKVTRKLDRCAQFLQQMAEGREWSQATTKLAELAGDTDFAVRHQGRLKSVLRDAEEVVSIKEFAVIRIGK